MWIAAELDDLTRRRRELTGSVALVPTMGALHDGHLSLVRIAQQRADHVLVSIFVNPTQFAPHEDFDRYPRPIEADLAACRDAGVTGVFHPTVEVMYPPGAPACEVNVPSMAGDLEGAIRPTHFAGVCRVVAKLLGMTQPDVACFGQKDFQQLRIIQAMVADLAMPVEVIGCPTLREDDGLARSSRNVYLDADSRRHARGLYVALQAARALIETDGETDPAAVEDAMGQVLVAHHIERDYAVVRHPATLARIDCIEPMLTGGVVALIAGRVGSVRLIDNALIACQPAG